MKQELSAKEINLQGEDNISPNPKKTLQRENKTEELEKTVTKRKARIQTKKKTQTKVEQKEKKEKKKEEKQPEIISHIKSDLPVHLL